MHWVIVCSRPPRKGIHLRRNTQLIKFWMIKPRNATVLLSGGIDSVACAHLLKSQGFSVHGVFFDYGQLAAKSEKHAVLEQSSYLDIPIQMYNLGGATEYTTGELTGRNSFLILGALFASQIKHGGLAIGIHSGTSYYDCSKPFIDSIASLISEQTNGRVVVMAPFLNWSKGDVYQYFVSSGLPVELTYSCEAGTVPPCATCLSCRDRIALGC